MKCVINLGRNWELFRCFAKTSVKNVNIDFILQLTFCTKILRLENKFEVLLVIYKLGIKFRQEFMLFFDTSDILLLREREEGGPPFEHTLKSICCSSLLPQSTKGSVPCPCG